MAERHRKRVPISCLNCKRRKVKCDRQKPACGGCVKNGVGHLCEYLEPHWSGNGASPVGKGSDLDKLSTNGPDTERFKELDDLRQTRLNHERIINNQRKEIEDLKRQLSFNNQLATDHKVYNENTSNRLISVLVKLNPLKVNSKDVLELQDVAFYLIRLNKRDNIQLLLKDLYSWTSIIKLDHKLSSLWHKIGNMQKIYHMYKYNLNHNHRKPNPKITEIDFTSTAANLNGSPANGSPANGAKCPVVLCDLHFMDDTIKTPQSTGTSIPSVTPIPSMTPIPSVASPSVASLNTATPFVAGDLTSAINEIWIACVRSLKDNQMLNATQLKFLLDFYFSDAHNSSPSKPLLFIYKDEIYDTFVVDYNQTLILKLFPSAQGLDSTLPVKGVYVSFLKIIINEAMDFFRSKLPGKMFDESCLKFQSLFANEIAYAGINGFQHDTLTNEVIYNFLEIQIGNTNSSTVFNRSVPTVTCLLLLTIKEIENSPSEAETKESKRFRCFPVLLKVLFDDNNPLEIWKNPSHISFPSIESKKKIKDIRTHFCHLWNELLRCLNLISFSLVVYKQSKQVNELVIKAYNRIEAVQINDDHVKYIDSFRSTQLDDLSISLKINYLLSKVQILLHRGMQNLMAPQLTIQELDNLIGGCGSWIEDDTLERLSFMKHFECKTMLHFCNIYVTYIVFLQAEEDKIDDLKEDLTITLFIKLDSFFKFVNGFLNKTKHLKEENQYYLTALSEIFVPVIQILIAILLRVCQRPPEKNENLLKHLSTVYYSMGSSVLNKEKSVTSLLRGQLSTFVTSLIKTLYARLSINKTHTIKLLRLWEFYLTILDGANKLDFNYARLHANVPEFNKMIDSDSASKFDKCPIAHVKPNNASDNGINTSFNGSGSGKTPPTTTGKCPIDHSKFMGPNLKRPQTEPRINSAAKRPKLENNGTELNGLPSNPTKIESSKAELVNNQISSDLSGYPAIDFDFNLNTLSNLNLDFLQDYSIFETFQDNQKSVEDLFQ